LAVKPALARLALNHPFSFFVSALADAVKSLVVILFLWRMFLTKDKPLHLKSLLIFSLAAFLLPPPGSLAIVSLVRVLIGAEIQKEIPSMLKAADRMRHKFAALCLALYCDTTRLGLRTQTAR